MLQGQNFSKLIVRVAELAGLRASSCSVRFYDAYNPPRPNATQIIRNIAFCDGLRNLQRMGLSSSRQHSSLPLSVTQ